MLTQRICFSVAILTSLAFAPLWSDDRSPTVDSKQCNSNRPGSPPSGAPETCRAPRVFRHPSGWIGAETESFRIWSWRSDSEAAETAAACESLRAELYRTWIGETARESWSPKCEVVLHPTLSGYQQSTGAPSGTGAATTIEIKRGKTLARRIDVCCTQAAQSMSVLPHELTHVLLKERFPREQIPRWIDEGMAVLAEPASKRQLRQQEVLAASASRTALRLHELVLPRELPAHRQGLFYGQSASLVEFLIQRGDRPRFLRFAAKAIESGYGLALQAEYQINDLPELEGLWQRHAARKSAAMSSDRVADSR